MLLYPNLVLLLVPVARSSVLLQAAGISYPAAVRCGLGGGGDLLQPDCLAAVLGATPGLRSRLHCDCAPARL
jgi:hypothetical protein